VKVCFLNGQPIVLPGLSLIPSLDEVRWLSAKSMGAPSPENIELLDESGERLDDAYVWSGQSI